MAQKTQILITDVPKDKFSAGWPNKLKNDLFEVKFPTFESHLIYFTPLSFLNRVVIIFDDEEKTMEVYQYLKTLKETAGMKVFISETLLKPRSKSLKNLNTNVDVNSNKTQPILSLDTNPICTGVTSGSLMPGSPSLSPDRTSLKSPTLLKFFGDPNEKPHYYNEPKPQTGNHNPEKHLQVEEVSPAPESPSITINEYFS